MAAFNLAAADNARLANGGHLDPGYFLMGWAAPFLAAEVLPEVFDNPPGTLYAAGYHARYDMPMPGDAGAFEAVAAGVCLQTGLSVIHTAGCKPLNVAPDRMYRTVTVARMHLCNALMFSGAVVSGRGRVDVIIGVLPVAENPARMFQASQHHQRVGMLELVANLPKAIQKQAAELFASWPGACKKYPLVAITRARHLIDADAADSYKFIAPSISRRFPCANAPRGAAVAAPQFQPAHPSALLMREGRPPNGFGLSPAERLACIDKYQPANDPKSVGDREVLRAAGLA